MKVSRSQSGGEQYLALQSIARATGQGFEQLAVLYALEGFLRRLCLRCSQCIRAQGWCAPGRV